VGGELYMFGHDDNNQHQNNGHPADDMANDDQGMSMPAVDDGSGGFMDDGAPNAGQAVTPDAGPALPVRGGDASNTDELLDIKQQALQQLTPLIGHLEQSPEEKFRTTMMMIQASDNDALVKAAYDAALAIPDEKTRAQALLDIVNEINYFTHNNNNAEV
jgi:hypothetical protein